ncbi:MAG: hypothetical protein HN658_03410, partial [Rhodospirillales bacterium]|nr:hypothetical protein [Rhodospirillales bacterium]
NLYVLQGGAATAREIVEDTVVGVESTVEEAMASIADAVSAPSSLTGDGSANSVTVSAAITAHSNSKLDLVREARLQGYEGDACGECGNFTLVRNGTCLKCNTCGSTSGCS